MRKHNIIALALSEVMLAALCLSGCSSKDNRQEAQNDTWDIVWNAYARHQLALQRGAGCERDVEPERYGDDCYLVANRLLLLAEGLESEYVAAEGNRDTLTAQSVT